MIDRFFRLIINNPRATLSSVFAVTLFLSFFIPNLKIDFSIEHLFSQNDPSVEKYFSFRNTFGREDNVITLIYKSKNIYDKKTYLELEDLVYGIEEIDGVKNVASIFSLGDLDLNAWLGNLYDASTIWDKNTILKKLQYIQKSIL